MKQEQQKNPFCSRMIHVWLHLRHRVMRDKSRFRFALCSWAWHQSVFDPWGGGRKTMLFRLELKKGTLWKGVYFIDQWLVSLFMTCLVLNMIWKPSEEGSWELLSQGLSACPWTQTDTLEQKYLHAAKFLNPWGAYRDEAVQFPTFVFIYVAFPDISYIFSS